MPVAKRRYSKEEFARRGETTYQDQVRPKLKKRDIGKFVAIDIETGDYQVDADEMRAGNKLLRRVPGAQIWMVRVGYRTVHSFGGRSLQRKTP